MNVDATSRELYESVLAPLVLGGALRPRHAIGVQEAMALGDPASIDMGLARRVHAARVRCARRLAAVDFMPEANGSEWALGASLNNILQSVNPAFSLPLRRRLAARILEAASAIAARVAGPATAAEALARHTWLARLFEVQRTDTAVSWWTGSRVFLGRDPPARIQAWPSLRRVEQTKSRLGLFELAPLPVSRDRLAECITSLLSRTPLTDVATCTRAEPVFAWSHFTLGLVAQRTGRTLALRALSLLVSDQVDEVLGGATRELFAKPSHALTGGVLSLLAERAIGALWPPEIAVAASSPSANALFARCLGAAAATRAVAAERSWPISERDRVLAGLRDAMARGPNLEGLLEHRSA